MQIACSRLLGFSELPTNVLTSTYADLAGDAGVLRLDNPKRNRRLGAAVLLLGGAISGGWLMRAGIGAHGVLWVAAGLKAVVVVFVWVALSPRVGVDETG
ncbi:hypothetical protein BDY21DRAFT_330746 [Lineolata rhizophorae]|uniref:Uncharacterized protein n=1 Tax=Lineolata rhizophorae TaxID=578093 RepID=A0A6A6PEF1_9PEZI|nr:hypothetical protein BDY21DRAFT_330746 [Lineolata rhizophorae]